MNPRRIVAAALAVGLSASLAACSGDEKPEKAEKTTPFEPAPVVLAGKKSASAEKVRLGVIVSYTSPAGEGGDFASATTPFPAAGAWVAAYRYQMAERGVELVIRDDAGRSSDAVKAVDELVAQKVAGIVVLSAGDHLAAALDRASRAGVAVVTPYLRSADDLPEGVWVTGPSDAQVGAAISTLADAKGYDTVVTINAPGAQDVAATGSAIAYDGDLPATLSRLGRLVRAGRADAVVVSAPSRQLAQIAAGVQGRFPSVRLVLTPEALTPTFAAALAAPASDSGDDSTLGGQGTITSDLTAIGVDAGDATTLAGGPRGDAAAAFFSAQRLAAASDVEIDGLGSLAEFAGGADIASHDAVVALVKAVDEAGSTDAAAVRTALADLDLTAADGLGGAELDFSDSTALADDAVVALAATTQDSGVRGPGTPGDDAGPIVPLAWFAVPTSEG